MTTPDLNLDDLLPRSWVMESIGVSWGWLTIVAGAGSSNTVTLSPGVWTVTGTWYGNVPAEIRYNDGGDDTTLAVVPAQDGDRAGVLTAQIPLRSTSSVFVRTQGRATEGARFALIAIPTPLAD